MGLRPAPLVLVAALTLGACDDEPARPAAPPGPASTETSAAPPRPASPPSTAPPSTAPAPTAARPITIAVAGDVHFEGVLRDRLEDPATALAPATATLAAADLAVVNLETSVGTGGRPEPGKRFTFQAPASAVTALAAGGVDVVTMANNHALDFGVAGVDFDALASGPLAVVGLGRDAREAFAPAVLDVDGTTVATLGATIAATDPTADPTGHWAATATTPGTADAVDPRRLLRAVAAADRSADVVVVYVHWGVQGDTCPSRDQRDLARSLVAAGADVVVGSHAHVLQGDGRLGEGYVAYGLGNYAWYQPAELTGVLTLTVQPGPARASVTDAAWSLARIGADGLPRPRGGAPATLAERRACAGLSAAS